MRARSCLPATRAAARASRRGRAPAVPADARLSSPSSRRDAHGSQPSPSCLRSMITSSASISNRSSGRPASCFSRMRVGDRGKPSLRPDERDELRSAPQCLEVDGVVYEQDHRPHRVVGSHIENACMPCSAIHSARVSGFANPDGSTVALGLKPTRRACRPHSSRPVGQVDGEVQVGGQAAVPVQDDRHTPYDHVSNGVAVQRLEDRSKSAIARLLGAGRESRRIRRHQRP